jgi:hypothetical protein
MNYGPSRFSLAQRVRAGRCDETVEPRAGEDWLDDFNRRLNASIAQHGTRLAVLHGPVSGERVARHRDVASTPDQREAYWGELGRS